jgi:hypothetical protein
LAIGIETRPPGTVVDAGLAAMPFAVTESDEVSSGEGYGDGPRL